MDQLADLVDTHCKAAAWAWHQRTSGSMAAAGPEVAVGAPHGARRSGPSRFKLEAEHLRRSNPVPPPQDLSDTSSESLHLTSTTTDTSPASFEEPNIINSTSPTESSTSTQSAGHPRSSAHLELALTSSYGAPAAWDCGSTLFDSFELVAMTKKLDRVYQLNHSIIGKVCSPHAAAEGAPENNVAEFESRMDGNEEDVAEGERSVVGNHMASTAARQLHDVGSLNPPNKELALSVVAGSSDQRRPSDDSDTTVPLLSPFPTPRRSRQAVYDMFCRYDKAVHQGNVFIMISEDAEDQCSHKQHTKKPKRPMAGRSKPQYRRRSFLSLSKVVRQHIAQLAGHSRASSTTYRHVRRPPAADDKPCARHTQSLSLPTTELAVTKLHRQSYSLPTESTAHRHSQSPKITPAVSPGTRIKAMGSPLHECSPQFESDGRKPSNQALFKQFSTDSVHHHYHHHYHHHHHHYLFRRHSDEAFTALPEPLLGADKSLLVAAAGLRKAQISSLQDYLSLNPKLEGMLLDHKRKIKDVNANVVSPMLSAPSPSVQV